jgi:hypothetical protein
MRYGKKFSLFILALGYFLGACNSPLTHNATDQELKSSETVFEVTLPASLENDAIIFLEILDEVTGISLNPERYQMEPKDDFSFFVRIPITNGSMIHYRYVKQTDIDQIEHDSKGKEIYYRTSLVNHPDIVKDKISNWTNQKLILPNGDISGYIFDNKTNLPLRGMNVSINGVSTVSLNNGFYEIADIPVGEYNLIAYHPNDLYEPFQQKAIIAEKAVTPASFGIDPAKLVQVTFNVEVPDNTIEAAPLRLLGDTSTLGNVFSKRSGIDSVIISRAPLMNYLGDNTYSISLELPSGSDLRYKYSLGNGFINAEYDSDGSLITHQLIVPKKDIEVNNQIISWSSENNYPITFQVSLPSDTPVDEYVSIQFNPFTWMQPIRMWKTENNSWLYSLYGPFEFLNNSQFRFCRNGLCGLADDLKTSGIDGSGYTLETDSTKEPRTIKYKIQNWKYLDDISYQFDKLNTTYENNSFIKGFQFSNKNEPKWLPLYNKGFIGIAVNGANLVVLPISRTITDSQTPIISFSPEINFSYEDQDILVTYAQDTGLNQALFPHIVSSDSTINIFWNSVSPTYDWWLEWFSQYERFILDQAVYAENANIPIFILGGKSILPALPSGSLPNGQLSNTPYDFQERWKELIEKIRESFSGQLLFAIPSDITDDSQYEFFQNIDAFYVEFESQLTPKTDPSVAEIKGQVNEQLDTSIYKLVENYLKPLILGINYASIDGSASNCTNLGSSCTEFLSVGSKQEINIDLAEQADIYTAILESSIEREWITGVVSQGYFPAAILRDDSTSTRGKPAMDVLSYYFNEVIK